MTEEESGSRTQSARPAARARLALPAGIWVLGLGSLLMDASSELVHSLLPVFMNTVLGASLVTVGLVEGVAEATAAITKVFSGALSDRLARRKPLVVLGYGLSAAVKPVFPLAGSIAWVFAARFADRIGKGIRGAPRDALVADLSPPSLRGAAYGLRQALDSVGAVMIALAEDIAAALWVAVVPALGAVALLATGVHERARPESGTRERARFLRGVRRLEAGYWWIVGLGAVFTLARFSEAFLVLRAQSVGLELAFVPAVLIVMNVAFALAAYPAGVAADRHGRRRLLLAGLAALVSADLVLARAGSAWQVLAGALLWGLHMALTQGLFAKLVADAVRAELRGTAFGVFHLVTGVALLLASAGAGFLWQRFGPQATFYAGATCAAVTAAGILVFPRAHGRNRAGASP